MKYDISFQCPICKRPVQSIMDNLHQECKESNPHKYWQYLMPTHWVAHPCKHKIKELGINEYGIVWCKPLLPNRIEVPQNANDEGFNAFIEGKEGADNPYHIGKSRQVLQEAGFEIVPLVHRGPVDSYEQLEAFCQEQSPFASEKREGVYLKVTDGDKVIKRFKMVRRDFIQGCHWSDKMITKNKLRK